MKVRNLQARTVYRTNYVTGVHNGRHFITNGELLEFKTTSIEYKDQVRYELMSPIKIDQLLKGEVTKAVQCSTHEHEKIKTCLLTDFTNGDDIVSYNADYIYYLNRRHKPDEYKFYTQNGNALLCFYKHNDLCAMVMPINTK